VKRYVAIALGLIAALSALGRSAVAHDHRPPLKALLTIGNDSSRGRPVSYGWIRPDRNDDRFCMATFADGFGWPRARAYVAEETTGSILLPKSAPPLEVRFVAYLDGHSSGPHGPSVPLPYVLRPATLETQPTAWTLDFMLPRTEEFFLELEAAWRDEEGCTQEPDLGEQYVMWRWRLRAEQ
jgi:hypothetical protein